MVSVAYFINIFTGNNQKLFLRNDLSFFLDDSTNAFKT